MTTPYDGRILLVNWVPSTTPGTTIADLAELLCAKARNVAGVMLKTSNGVSWQGHLGSADPSPQAVTGVTRIRQWVDEFARYDLEVHVWGVPRAKRPPGASESPDIDKEAEKFILAASVPGIKSLLLDVEHGPYYWLGTPDEVRRLMSRVRTGVPDGVHIAMILDGTLAEGDALPSVRTVASELQLNPITVSKSYQALVDEGLVEKRRGLGMFVCEGAHHRLLDSERQRFREREWPAVIKRIRQLGLDPGELLKNAGADREPSA